MAEPSENTELYDNAHGKRSLKDEQKPSGLSEGSNKSPPQYNPIKGAK